MTDANDDAERHARWEITRLFNAMPYGGIANFLRHSSLDPPEPLTLAEITENLKRLQAVLGEVSANNERDRSELFQVHADFAAIGRMIERAVNP